MQLKATQEGIRGMSVMSYNDDDIVPLLKSLLGTVIRYLFPSFKDFSVIYGCLHPFQGQVFQQFSEITPIDMIRV